jgi:phenylpyruvate tautomerase PptA (4-oxalocrotonate tautomerase family)
MCSPELPDLTIATPTKNLRRHGKLPADGEFKTSPTRKDQIMPIIRVTTPENTLTAEQKAQLAPLLVDAVMVEEVDPVTEAARNATFMVFTEIPQQDAFGANDQPFWLVEAMTAAGFFDQARRDDAQDRVAKAFVKVLGDDGSSVEMGGKTISPAFLAYLYCLIIEIPEGSWGFVGHTFSAPEIGQVIGSDKDPKRWSELKVNTAKLQASRPS